MRKTKQNNASRRVRHQVTHDAVESKLFYGLMIVAVLVGGFITLAILRDTAILSKGPKTEAPGPDSDTLTAQAATSGFIDGNQIDVAALSEFDQNYDLVKREVGMNNEFYVYFEDQDGAVLQVDGKKCFGSDIATRVDPRCK